MKRRVILGGAPAALLAACGPQPSGPRPGEAPPAAGKPVKGGTLTIAMERDSTNFDPNRLPDVYSAVVLNNVADTLFELDKNNTVVGRLVEKTENPQPNVYVFTLRQGVKFHDGTPFNAEAVKFNLQRHIDDPRSVRIQDVKDITAIETPDQYTVRITLKAPFAPFTNKLTGGAGYMLSPTAVQKLGENLQRDLTGAGSGPFKFVEWRKDTHVVLERNPESWRKDAEGTQLPYLDRLVFKPFPDENVRLTNIRTGDADVLLNNPPYKDVQNLKATSDLVVREIPGLGWFFIALSTDKEPFNNPALRRAVSYAIDREQIRRTVYFGNGKTLAGPIPEVIPWAHEKDHPYQKRDVAKAKQELAAGGKPNGFKFTLQLRSGSPEWQQATELMKDQLKEVGIDMEIQLLEFAAIVSNALAGNHQASSIGWSGGTDPDDDTYSLFFTKAGFNLAQYSNPQMDKLLNDGRTNLERNKRAEVYKQVQKLFFEEVPFIIFYNSPQISTVRKNVQNYPQTYNGWWGTQDFDKIWKTQ